MNVLRNGLVQRFSNHLYLFFFCIVSILIVLQREQVLIEWKLSGLVFDMLELEDIPGRGLKPSIRTLFGKTIHFNCPLKLCNNFISFREPINFSKQTMFFIEIFKITDNNLKIKRSSWNFKSTFYIYENTLMFEILGMRRIHNIHGPHATGRYIHIPRVCFVWFLYLWMDRKVLNPKL